MIDSHPAGLRTLFFTEMWERFSYYGMRGLLVLFMAKAAAEGGMGLSDATATAIYGLYTAVVYLAALPGGWLADRLLGPQRAVWYGGLVIAGIGVGDVVGSYLESKRAGIATLKVTGADSGIIFRIYMMQIFYVENVQLPKKENLFILHRHQKNTHF